MRDQSLAAGDTAPHPRRGRRPPHFRRRYGAMHANSRCQGIAALAVALAVALGTLAPFGSGRAFADEPPAPTDIGSLAAAAAKAAGGAPAPSTAPAPSA